MKHQLAIATIIIISVSILSSCSTSEIVIDEYQTTTFDYEIPIKQIQPTTKQKQPTFFDPDLESEIVIKQTQPATFETGLEHAITWARKNSKDPLNPTNKEIVSFLFHFNIPLYFEIRMLEYDCCITTYTPQWPIPQQILLDMEPSNILKHTNIAYNLLTPYQTGVVSFCPYQLY